jgi:hypothetical protein
MVSQSLDFFSDLMLLTGWKDFICFSWHESIKFHVSTVLYLLLVEISAGETVSHAPSNPECEMEIGDAVPGPSQDTSSSTQDAANRSSGRQSFCHNFKIGKIPIRLRCVF